MEKQTLLDIEKVYDDFLVADRRKGSNEPKKGFIMSYAGQCYRKHKFRIEGVPQDDIPKISARTLRLGKLLHKDFEKAFKWYSRQDDAVEIMAEHNVSVPNLGIKGRLDKFYKINKTAVITDIKSAKSFTWRRKFGRKENRDSNPSLHYELQMGSYALALLEDESIDSVRMFLLYYRKDDGMMKSVEVDQKFISMAKQYWEDVNDVFRVIVDIEDFVPGKVPNVPVYSWECSYCPWSSKCPSPFKKK